MTSKMMHRALTLAVVSASLYSVSHAAQPSLSVHIQSEKTQYLLGEPTRVTVVVRNLSDETLVISKNGYYEVTSPDSKVRLREDRTLSAPSIELVANDSTLFFLYPSHTAPGRDANGEWPHSHDYRTFQRAGAYSIRVSCHATIRRWTDLFEATGGATEAWSNPISMRFAEPQAREAKVLEALWRSRAVSNTYFRGEWQLHDGIDEQHLDRLRATARRSARSPMITYVNYAIARILIDPSIEYPDKPSLFEGSQILEQLSWQYADFRPEEVAYYRAIAELRGYQAGFSRHGQLQAKEIMSKLMDAHPELSANREISILANRVAESGEEIEVRLGLDKREYVVGEPILVRVSMANRSTRTVRAPGPALLRPREDMYCGFVEIERSDGTRELRAPNHPIVDYIGWHPDIGVPLAPGDSVASRASYSLFEVGQEEFGYRTSSAWSKVFATPGRYRLSAACGLPQYVWRLNGAGRVVLSKSVDVRVRKPGRVEADLLNTLERATGGGAFNELITDATNLELVREKIAEYPSHPLTFYLRRAVARSAMGMRGQSPDPIVALRLWKDLERDATGWRREELRFQMLWVYSYLRNENKLDPSLRHEAEDLVARMGSENRALWGDDWFCRLAFSIRLSEVGPSSLAEVWWMRKLRDAGPAVPSFDQLRAVVAATPVRRETTGPIQPRREQKAAQQIHR